MKCEWKECVLSDVADIVDSLHKTPKYTEHGIPMLRVTDIKEGYLSLQSSVKVSLDIYDEFTKKHKPEIGDIVISRVGTYGVFSYVNTDEKFCLGQNTAIIIPHINTKFLYYFLISPMVKKYLSSVVTGSTQKTISLKNIKTIPLHIPSDVIQKRIANILSALDDKIECNNKINENLQQQAQAIFKAWFIDDPRIAGWRMSTFSELIEKTISGDWGKQTATGNYTEMVYCIRGADIPEVRQGNKGKMPIRYILAKNYAAKKLVNGDLVVEISGGSPTQSTGRVAAISSALLNRYDKGMVCTNFCKALKPIDGYSMYIYHYWQYLYDKGVFFSYENGTTGIKNLDINGFLETEPIHIAPKELVEKFDTICQFIFSVVYANGLENERLAQLRDTLLPKLMNGEIDVDGI